MQNKRKNDNQLYARRIHRFLGVFIGIQSIFWTVSGFYFSWTDIDEIHGDQFHETHMMHKFVSDLVNTASLDSTLEISTMELRFVRHQPYYWVNEKRLFKTKTSVHHAKVNEA
jgi:hypothetical protein